MYTMIDTSLHNSHSSTVVTELPLQNHNDKYFLGCIFDSFVDTKLTPPSSSEDLVSQFSLSVDQHAADPFSQFPNFRSSFNSDDPSFSPTGPSLIDSGDEAFRCIQSPSATGVLSDVFEDESRILTAETSRSFLYDSLCNGPRQEPSPVAGSLHMYNSPSTSSCDADAFCPNGPVESATEDLCYDSPFTLKAGRRKREPLSSPAAIFKGLSSVGTKRRLSEVGGDVLNMDHEMNQNMASRQFVSSLSARSSDLYSSGGGGDNSNNNSLLSDNHSGAGSQNSAQINAIAVNMIKSRSSVSSVKRSKKSRPPIGDDQDVSPAVDLQSKSSIVAYVEQKLEGMEESFTFKSATYQTHLKRFLPRPDERHRKYIERIETFPRIPTSAAEQRELVNLRKVKRGMTPDSRLGFGDGLTIKERLDEMLTSLVNKIMFLLVVKFDTWYIHAPAREQIREQLLQFIWPHLPDLHAFFREHFTLFIDMRIRHFRDSVARYFRDRPRTENKIGGGAGGGCCSTRGLLHGSLTRCCPEEQRDQHPSPVQQQTHFSDSTNGGRGNFLSDCTMSSTNRQQQQQQPPQQAPNVFPFAAFGNLVTEESSSSSSPPAPAVDFLHHSPLQQVTSISRFPGFVSSCIQSRPRTLPPPQSLKTAPTFLSAVPPSSTISGSVPVHSFSQYSSGMSGCGNNSAQLNGDYDLKYSRLGRRISGEQMGEISTSSSSSSSSEYALPMQSQINFLPSLSGSSPSKPPLLPPSTFGDGNDKSSISINETRNSNNTSNSLNGDVDGHLRDGSQNESFSFMLASALHTSVKVPSSTDPQFFSPHGHEETLTAAYLAPSSTINFQRLRSSNSLTTDIPAQPAASSCHNSNNHDNTCQTGVEKIVEIVVPTRKFQSIVQLPTTTSSRHVIIPSVAQLMPMTKSATCSPTVSTISSSSVAAALLASPLFPTSRNALSRRGASGAN